MTRGQTPAVEHAVARALEKARRSSSYEAIENAAATGYGHADNLIAAAFRSGLLEASEVVTATDGKPLPSLDAKIKTTPKGRRWLDKYAEVYESYRANKS